jgi:phosphoglycolate phosphatase-like HAD superfamily hydrolase
VTLTRLGWRAALPRGDDLKLVIFDCDGVLFDSWKANVAFYDAVLASLGLPPLDVEGRRLCHTLSSPQLYARLFGADEGLHRRVVEAARGVRYAPFYDLMEPVPALHETLGRLARHCPLALATNRGTTVEGVVEHFRLREFFGVRVGILDVARPKPAPDLLLTCLERARVTADAAVYVGDTDLDHDAATAAEVAYVGVGEQSRARWMVRGIRELPSLLLSES